MKFTERSNGSYDVHFANLAGRITGPIHDDLQRPQHVYVLWIDEDLTDIFKGLGIKVKEKEDGETGKVSYSVQFKAYPKIRLNRKNGKEELYLEFKIDDLAEEARGVWTTAAAYYYAKDEHADTPAEVIAGESKKLKDYISSGYVIYHDPGCKYKVTTIELDEILKGEKEE